MPFGIVGRTGPVMRQVVGFGDRSMGRGTFGGRIWGAPLSTGTYRVYVCCSTATQPSCQITLGRLVCHRQLCASKYAKAIRHFHVTDMPADVTT